VGECVRAGHLAVGDGCESGPVTANVDARRDRAELGPSLPCGDGAVCEANAAGFPGGMCSSGCGGLAPGAVCGAIPLLAEFNGCLAAGTPVERCIADNARPGALRACGFHEPCRDDYVCARSANGGVCMPPYFLFQLRVDGHPL
jgi:hypothetical protein